MHSARVQRLLHYKEGIKSDYFCKNAEEKNFIGMAGIFKRYQEPKYRLKWFFEIKDKVILVTSCNHYARFTK